MFDLYLKVVCLLMHFVLSEKSTSENYVQHNVQIEIKHTQSEPNMKLTCIFGIIFEGPVLMMAVTKPLLTEFGI